MDNNEVFEKSNKAKDISEIRSEINKIKCLLINGNSQELQSYLLELQGKYIFETAAYNMTHLIPPQSVEENALNCLDFLNALFMEKAAEELKDN